MSAAVTALQFLRAVQSTEIAIESPERKVTRSPGRFEHETVGEADSRPGAELVERRRHDIGILQRQLTMAEEELNSGGNVGWATLVDCVQDPRGFNECDVGHPGALLDESLSRGDLRGVVSRDQPDQDVRINGPHAEPARVFGARPSIRQESVDRVDPRQRRPDEYPQT